jgi:anti-sigma factor ChrR (cupin superfamily)
MMRSIMNLFDEFNWIPADNYPDGTQKKMLRDENGANTFLLKLPKGFKMEAHSHVTTEQHLVIEGSYSSEGVNYPAGSYLIISAHENHGPFESEEGAMMLVVRDPY